MDKTGLITLIIGLVLCALGGFAIWIFLPEVILAVKGLIGIVVLFVGHHARYLRRPDLQRLKKDTFFIILSRQGTATLPFPAPAQLSPRKSHRTPS